LQNACPVLSFGGHLGPLNINLTFKLFSLTFSLFSSLSSLHLALKSHLLVLHRHLLLSNNHFLLSTTEQSLSKLNIFFSYPHNLERVYIHYKIRVCSQCLIQHSFKTHEFCLVGKHLNPGRENSILNLIFCYISVHLSTICNGVLQQARNLLSRVSQTICVRPIEIICSKLSSLLGCVNI